MLFKDKKVEDTTAGITKRITNGFVIPPVKKTSTANCIRSYAKYNVELKLDKSVFFSLNCKYRLLKIPKKNNYKTIKIRKIKFKNKINNIYCYKLTNNCYPS